MKDYNKAKELLQQLVVKSNETIKAIDNNRSIEEISKLGIEDIENLTEQIYLAIIVDNLFRINRDSNINYKKTTTIKICQNKKRTKSRRR